MAASSSGGITVPVGLAGLATTTPCTGGSSAASICAVGWNRVSGPHGISTTSQPKADKDVAVAGVAGTGDGHPVADVEARKEREQESTARAGGDHHLARVDDDAVPVRI